MAKRYYNAMLREGVEPTRHSYNILIWGMFLSLRLNTAVRFYDDMKTRGIEPNVVTYNTLINGYLRFKKVDEAENLFVEMKGRNLVPNVISFTTMLKGYVDAGNVDRAVEVFEEMKSCGIKPNAATFTTLLPGLCDAEKMDVARNVLGEMVERYVAPKDNSVFMKLMVCQCKVGNLDAAADVLKAMIRLSMPTEAGHYGVLIENFCKASVYDRAEKLLDKLIEKEIVLRPQSSCEMEPSAYNLMIEYLCDNGKTVKAETFFRQLLKKGVQDSVAFNNLICGHSKEGNPESALEIVKIMGRRGVADSYRLLIEKDIAIGFPIYDKVLDELLGAGKTLNAYSILCKIVEKRGTIDWSSRDEPIKTLNQEGNTKQADVLSRKIKEKEGSPPKSKGKKKAARAA